MDNPRDRSREFFEFALRSRQAAVAASSSAAFSSRPTSVVAKSPFSEAASLISKDIHETANMIRKLATLAQNKSKFDDRSDEIQKLTFRVKENITLINSDLNLLQERMNEQGGGRAHDVREHSMQVMGTLKAGLADTTKQFKEALQVRTENLKLMQDRGRNFSNAPIARSTPSFIEMKLAAESSNSRSENIRHRKNQSDSVIDIPSQQQSQMIELQEPNYLEQRAEAVEQIEKMIGELGQMFQTLATMISMQGQMIQRIDDDVEDTLGNVNRAQSQLQKYLTNISSNRWLIIQVFGILIFFIILFLVFVL